MSSVYYLDKIQVKNFRNLKDQVINFGPRITCIFGNNGNGKTNILEAIYYLINKKSFKKKTTFPQILSMDCEYPEILIQSVIKDNIEKAYSFSLRINSETAEAYLNSKILKKRLNIPIVFINPYDAQSFFLIPQFRRQWIDQHLAQFDENFRKNLSKYKHFLKFKNLLLLERPYQYQEQIIAAHCAIAPVIAEINLQKKVFIDALNEKLQAIFQNLFSENMKLELFCEISLIAQNSKEILNRLNQHLVEEIRAQKTLWGPHRDDYSLLINGISAFDYASLGQQKSSYLSILFAYIELFRYKFNASPIVLMDDVSGELDSLRWGQLISFLKSGEFQVIITTANEKFKEELEKIDGVKKIKVVNGSVI